ncbi:hypothetical protein UPYG_G00275160 [Umbra pygmaea]|uniref:Uncharacterized protein n=1 Tax=Umbra pygmaea TaxID=75934 RepID=A0ABD0W338_UMBPY
MRNDNCQQRHELARIHQIYPNVTFVKLDTNLAGYPFPVAEGLFIILQTNWITTECVNKKHRENLGITQKWTPRLRPPELGLKRC